MEAEAELADPAAVTERLTSSLSLALQDPWWRSVRDLNRGMAQRARAVGGRIGHELRSEGEYQTTDCDPAPHRSKSHAARGAASDFCPS